MKYLKHFFCILVFVSASSAAFEFNNNTAPYDFSQTVDIFIVDQKNEKFFGMFDPFEMKRTTIPSRFYVSVLGAIERGHRNAEGVVSIEGAVNEHDYVLIFRSLNRSHVLFIGSNWMVDGNKKILLTSQEVVAIYELLLHRSNSDQKTDLKKLEGLFAELNNQQAVDDNGEKISADYELESIAEAKKTIEERLPESHDDIKNLPYYNKVVENQKFREELQKAEEKNEQQEENLTRLESSNPAENGDELTSQEIAPSNEVVTENKLFMPEQEKSQNNNLFTTGLVLFTAFALLYFILLKRVRDKKRIDN